MSITIYKSAHAAMYEHAAARYPEECCGVMLGHDDTPTGRLVVETLAFDNKKIGERRRHYLIEPADMLAAERTARAKDMDVVGIYHSHPDHPSRASETDRVHAMPFWSYVIVSCMAGQSVVAQCWRLRDDRSRFDEEALTIQDGR